MNTDKPKGKARTGRPPLAINQDQVLRLAAMLCTNEEIASVMGCSADTIERRFAGALKKGRAQGKTTLRRAQYEAAGRGNPTMLIWLGKQYLAQANRPEVLHDFKARIIRSPLAGPAVDPAEDLGA